MDMNAEPPHFALGVGSFTSSAQRLRQHSLERQRRYRQPADRTSMHYATTYMPAFTLKPSMWLLLPKEQVDPAVWSAFSLVQTGSFKAIYNALKVLTAPPPFSKNQVKIPIAGLKPFSVANPVKALEKANQTIYLNQNIRWCMRRLVQRWRLAHMKQINQEDPVTMEVPTTPVVIYDWPNRSKYVFEARSLARDFRNRLTHHDQLFLEPKVPRNPFTNAPLSLGQIHFTLNALRLTGQMDWTLEAYRSVAYDIGELHKRYKHALSLDALRRVFVNPTSEDCVDLVFDFIYSEHENHDATMRRQDVWLWFLRNQPAYPRIQMWRSWWYAYYRAYLTETEANFQTIVDGIRTETAELVGRSMADMLARWRLEMAGAKTSSLSPAGEGDSDADSL